MALKIYDTLAPQGTYPAVRSEDVQMPDGSRLSDSWQGANFDLSAFGMPPVALGGGAASVQAYTTDIVAALNKGPVMVTIPVIIGENTINVNFLMSAATFGGMYQCVAVVNYGGAYAVELIVAEGVIQVSCPKMLDFAGVPEYVEEYIGSALEGEY